MADPTTSLGLPLPPDSTKVSQTMAKLREYAQTTDQVLHNHVVDGTDGAVAGAVNLTTSQTRTALKNWRSSTTPLIHVELATTDQVLGTGALEWPVVWNSSTGDTDMNPAGFKDRLVAPVAGWYEVTGTVIFSNTSGGQRAMGFQTWKGASQGTKRYYRGQNNTSPSSSFFLELTSSLTCYLEANEYVKVTVEVNGATASTSIKASQGTRACLKYLRP